MILLSARSEELLAQLQQAYPYINSRMLVELALERVLELGLEASPADPGHGEEIMSEIALMRPMWLFAAGLVAGAFLTLVFAALVEFVLAGLL